MEETIVFNPPPSNCNYDDIYPIEHLPIPPLDYSILTDDLSFPDNLTFAQPSDADLEFTIKDLEFIDDLLSDPDPGSPDRNYTPSERQPVPHSDKISVSGEGFNSASVDERLGSEAACDLVIIEDSEPPRVFVAEHAKREQESSGHVSSQGSGNGERHLSKAMDNRSSESNFERKSDYQSPESGSCDQFSSHGSGEFNSGVSPVEIPRSPDSRQSSPHFSSSLNVSALKAENFALNGLAESRIKIEEIPSKFTPKRKKEHQDEGSAETRTSKFRKSSEALENASVDLSMKHDDDDKKKARLMRNRESAQLSRQRKKQYVEELEDKVKAMHSTITELNSKMSYIMAENATLRQQLSGGGVCPPPGMYPMAPMGYPWMPCPAYVVKPQGSQVPLVPIPRLKPQKPASVPKVSKKAEKLESKKEVGNTKKVASISFIGLLFFMLLFGGLVPIVNVKYGGKLSVPNEFSKTHNGWILMVDGRLNETSRDSGSAHLDRRHGHESGLFKGKHCGISVGKKEHPTQFGTGANGSVHMGNSSEPLAASLYVPRNDKLVKIDGNLIIHSVLASERAVASHGMVQTKTSEETRLAIARNYAPSYHATGAGQSNRRGSQLDDGNLQEWFREDLSDSLLRSGMCTEVFQFDVSPTPGSIIPATPMTNRSNTTDQRKNSPNKSRNRRFLSGYPIPLDLHALNVTNEHVGPNTEKVRFRGDNSSSSMVVSVLVDPREAGESDSDGVRRPKSLSRIFVVVLIDSVKYVTYSCMLPLMGGSSLHLVTN